MASQGQRELIGLNAAAVIIDRDTAHTAFLDAQLDALRTGIDRVFEQLLDHRGRSLDHFAGRDLADQMVGQGGDPAALCFGLGLACSVVLSLARRRADRVDG